VYLNNGTGFQFDTVLEYASTSWVGWVDWDGDGDLDLGEANFNGDVDYVYANDGGVLTAVWQSAAADESRTGAWGDFDGDGDPDLANGNTQAPIRLYRSGGP
jgi:hypothetical protein